METYTIVFIIYKMSLKSYEIHVHI